MDTFNGLGTHLGNVSRLSEARSRSITPENFTGEPGKGGMATEGTGASPGRDLGAGWKISPSIEILPGETFTLADIAGQGALQHFWITFHGHARARNLILRIFWDDQEVPSVEVPIGDFFASGWGEFSQVSSIPVCVNPARGLNCFWEMPFRKRALVTLENRDDEDITVYYQIDYALTEVPPDRGYFHAQFRRVNPLPYKEVHTILDGVQGWGHYVGTYLAWGVNNSGWWGEGEVKFYIDDDDEFPTICGTGTEDYFCGSHNFDVSIVEPNRAQAYVPYTGPFAGLPQVIRPDGCYRSQQRFGMYRWHIPDPIRFRNALKVTVQGLGWRNTHSERKYLPLQDDIASTAFWYQQLPTAAFPELPDVDHLEII